MGGVPVFIAVFFQKLFNLRPLRGIDQKINISQTAFLRLGIIGSRGQSLEDKIRAAMH